MKDEILPDINRGELVWRKIPDLLGKSRLSENLQIVNSPISLKPDKTFSSKFVFRIFHSCSFIYNSTTTNIDTNFSFQKPYAYQTLGCIPNISIDIHIH